MEYPAIYLRSGKDKSIKRFHPWVFSGAVKHIEVDGALVQPEEGSIVQVCDKKGRFLGIGHFQGGNIAVRILSFDDVKIDSSFWEHRLANAFNLRKQLGLVDNKETNAYRLVFAEGDLLPGLIIDIYNKTAVVQTASMGMQLAIEEIKDALLKVMGDRITAVYNKSESVLKSGNHKDGFIHGTPQGNEVAENGLKFMVEWEKGQKTGFFIDQRENRDLVRTLANGKKVLNTFCYTGGFSVAAYAGGALSVASIDSSESAIELCRSNLILNGFSDANCVAEDTLQYIKSMEEQFDMIILDPPAYAKNIKAKHNAVQGYKRLNAEAIKKIAPGGLLFTFSCSGVITRGLFENTIVAAAISVGRNARILYHLSQPSDHPINIYHQEGEYLKGLVLQID